MKSEERDFFSKS